MLVLGHRGAITSGLSQNSLRAFMRACDEADGFETDACVSKDGEVFLIHEAKYADAAKGVEYSMVEHLDDASRVKLGERRMEQLTGAEVRELRLLDGQGIPSLQEALELVGSQRGKVINIELKAHAVVEPVLRLVASCLRKGVIEVEALLISSFNHFALPVVRRDLPGVRVGAIFIGSDQPTARLFPWHADDPGAYASLTIEALRHSVLQQVRPDCFVVPEEILTLETVRMIDAVYPAAQIAAWVFTEKGHFDLAGLIARLKTMAEDKVLAIIADHPGAFVRAL